jgi:hypothetical protein
MTMNALVLFRSLGELTFAKATSKTWYGKSIESSLATTCAR